MIARAEFALVIPYGDRRIRCNVRRSEQRSSRSVAIHVEPDGRVLVDAPVSAAEKDIRWAVTQRVVWIHRRQMEIDERLKYITLREYVSGETAFYMGRRYRLKVSGSRSSQQVRLRGGYIEVSAGSRDRSAVRRVLMRWYRARAQIVLFERLDAVASRLPWLSVAPPVSLRAMKVQWGSCSPAGKLLLNPDLIRAPGECIDYVLLHELCHLKEHNHGPRFHRLLDRHMPEWRRIKMRLDAMAETLLSR
jgi:predicted metal-dependent hydrolase